MNNTDAISRGLAQSAAGETVDLGDFTQYLIPDAAVEAVGEALGIAWFEEGGDAQPPSASTIRAALTAALPFLGAAPSATREDVEAAIFEADDEYALEVHEVRSLASRLLARFTIAPRTDR